MQWPRSISTIMFIFASLFFYSSPCPYSDQGDTSVGDVGGVFSALSLQSDTGGYDSDSEDESEYQYVGLKDPLFSDKHEVGSRYLLLSRGIHFSPSRCTKVKRSHLRRSRQAGMPVYATAVYDMVGEDTDYQGDESVLHAQGEHLKNLIAGLSDEQRRVFQQRYTNSYDGFHDRLGSCRDDGIFRGFASRKNPQVSTSESFVHSGKYAAGVKFLGKEVEKLTPDYDAQGKPRHPYLGKLYAVLLPERLVEQVAPFFVVWAHANKHVNVSTHFSNDILSEREVTFPGYIPEGLVVLSQSLRVPAFNKGWHDWYEQKYGMSKQAFTRRKNSLQRGKVSKNDARSKAEVRIKVAEKIVKDVICHTEKKLRNLISEACKKRGSSLVYKQLDGSFASELSSLTDAKALHKER